MDQLNDKTIKSYFGKRFSVELMETPSGLFIIRYDKADYMTPQYSEAIKDYNTASYLFELKLDELEGH